MNRQIVTKDILAPGTVGSAVIPATGSSVMAGIFSLQVFGIDSMLFLSKSVRGTEFVIPSWVIRTTATSYMSLIVLLNLIQFLKAALVV